MPSRSIRDVTRRSALRLGLLLLLGCCASASADTTWVSAGSVSGTWTSEGSPYMIHEGNVIVDSEQSLTIEPGVRVFFTEQFEFRVEGLLSAVGTIMDSIEFTSDPEVNPQGWFGLRFYSAHRDCELAFCVIERGRAAGGGDYRWAGAIECMDSSPEISDCTLRYCFASIEGGAIYIRDGSEPHLTRCHIYGNTSNFGGGGVFCRAGADPILDHCVIENNVSDLGGGIGSSSTSDPVITGCTIRGNSAVIGGGFHCDRGFTTPALTNCLFENNYADASGGAIYLRGTSAEIMYCVFIGNDSPTASIHLDSTFTWIHSTIIAHADEGAGVHYQNSPESSVEYCDLFENAGGAFSGATPADLGVPDRVNLNEDSTDAYGNIFLDPRFQDLFGGDYHLRVTSPCLAAGMPGHDLPVDADGQIRPLPDFTQPDIGMFESIEGSPQQICGTVSGTIGPGAVVALCNVRVVPGTQLRIVPGTTVLFAGDFVLTILGDLQALGSPAQPIVFSRFDPDESARWGGIHFSGADATCRMEHSIFSYAHASGTNVQGGAVRLTDSSPTFVHCTFQSNEALGGSGEGGAVYCADGSDPEFSSCTFYENSATLKGGAVSVGPGCRPEFSKCTFEGNSCGFTGGAIYVEQAAASFTLCEIAENQSGVNGGGAYFWWSDSEIDACLVTHNSAAGRGGGCYVNGDSPRILGSTFSQNSAGTSGAGIHLNQSTAEITSTIVAYSQGSGLGFSLSNAEAVIAYCDVFGNSPQNFTGLENAPADLGINSTTNFNGDLCDRYFNIFVNPQFADTGAADYRIGEESPCVNAGDPRVSLDQDGTIRDIGAESVDLPFAPSSTFGLLSPPDSSGVDEADLTLDWGASFEIETQEVPLYVVQIAEDEDFSVGVQGWLADTSGAQITGLEDSTFYSWRVLAVSANGSAQPSDEVWTFQTIVRQPPEPFDLLQPPHDTTMYSTDSQLFCWEQSHDVDAGDFVTYSLMFLSVDTTVAFTDLTDTCLNVIPATFGFSRTEDVQWWVVAHSFIPDTSTECNERFILHVVDTTTAAGATPELPTRLDVTGVYPNPFNAVTTIEFDVPRESEITLEAYNVAGQLAAMLRDGRAAAGRHRLTWSAEHLSSGIYFLHLRAPTETVVRKVVLLK